MRITPLSGVLVVFLALAWQGEPCAAQSALGRSPNLRPTWSAAPTVFVFAHRFELIEGGDHLLNVPTLTLGRSLAPWLAVGLDFTSNSEIVPARLGANETQYWVSMQLPSPERGRIGTTMAWNSVARSFDAAATGSLRIGDVSLLAEGRVFSDLHDTGSGGAAGAVGGVVHLTSHLELSADAGRLFRPDTLGVAWSAGVAIAIPGTPHTFSLNASNGGALTLQSVSRPKVFGPERVRYGFTFTAPLGTGAQWGRIFRRHQEHQPPSDTARNRVVMRDVAFMPAEIRVRVGDRIEWRNDDPLVHTVTADDRSWGSGLLHEGDRFAQTFAAPGRYTYHCLPHPQMRGIVIVAP